MQCFTSHSIVILTELMHGSFSGCKALDISHNDVISDRDHLLSLWIRHDMALRHLNISCVDKDVVPSILDAVAGMFTRSVQSE